MILQDAFTVEPWNLRETHLDPDLLARTESVFALANGRVGWRANLDEGEPHALPGSYLNGVYETRPLPYAEEAYGLPETGQEIINITNGKLIRCLRLVRCPVADRGQGPGVGGADRGPAGRLGRAARRPAPVPG